MSKKILTEVRMDGKVVSKVEAFQFYAREVMMDSDYYPYRTWDGITKAVIQGPSRIRVELEGSSHDYSKEDWGDLMSAITAGRVWIVIDGK